MPEVRFNPVIPPQQQHRFVSAGPPADGDRLHAWRLPILAVKVDRSMHLGIDRYQEGVWTNAPCWTLDQQVDFLFNPPPLRAQEYFPDGAVRELGIEATLAV